MSEEKWYFTPTMKVICYSMINSPNQFLNYFFFCSPFTVFPITLWHFLPFLPFSALSPLFGLSSFELLFLLQLFLLHALPISIFTPVQFSSKDKPDPGVLSTPQQDQTDQRWGLRDQFLHTEPYCLKNDQKFSSTLLCNFFFLMSILVSEIEKETISTICIPRNYICTKTITFFS